MERSFGGKRAAAYKFAAKKERESGIENVQVRIYETSNRKPRYAVTWNAIRYSNPRRKTTARRKRNCKTKRRTNPKGQTLSFASKAAARKYAKAHGKKIVSLRKIKLAR